MTKTGPILYYVPKAACDPAEIVKGDDVTGGLQAPSTGRLNLEALPSPLDERFTGFDAVPGDVIINRSRGPDGGGGTCLFPKRPSDGAHATCVIYDPSHQTWHSRGGGSYWIGWQENHLPHPSWMERRGIQWNYDIGSLWKLAVCRSPDHDRIALPMVWGFDADQRLVKTPVKLWQTYFDLAGKALAHLQGDDVLTDDQLMALAVELVGMNYRIGPDEIWLAQREIGLEWFRYEVIMSILAICCDWEKVIEHMTLEEEKKTVAA